MDYNLVMYIGVGLIVFGFLGFLFCEMKEREIDRKIAENQHFINAILKTQMIGLLWKIGKKIKRMETQYG